MTSPAPAEGNPSAGGSSSEGPAIDVYLFPCGHGDTILVRLPGGRWGLIDCYLPEQYGVRRSFFKFLDDHKVETFDFIFQTHPDRDHYHGMEAVIEHFLGRGAKIGCYIDTGLNARCARSLFQMWPGGATEYEHLQKKLEEWRDGGLLLRWGELAARCLSFVPKGHDKEIEFVPVGPDPEVKRRIMTSDLRKLGNNPEVRPEANELSLVVVLSVKMKGRTLNVLLGADAGKESLVSAMGHWRRRAREIKRDGQFDAVKVPHHGSIASHVPDLCRMKRPGAGTETAAVSAGARRALPGREVLRDYIENGWNVVATTTRDKPSATSRPMALANRGALDDGDVSKHTIHLSWSFASGLSVGPDAAKIRRTDLDRYQTAAKSVP